MNRWNQCRLIDLLSRIDLSLLEGRFPETDLDGKEAKAKRRRRGRRRAAAVSGLSAGLAALAGAALLFLKWRDSFHKSL